MCLTAGATSHAVASVVTVQAIQDEPLFFFEFNQKYITT